jgi:hypothetical protein
MKEDEMDWICSTHRKDENIYKMFVGNNEGEGPVRRPRPKWEGSIKMDLQEIGCEDVNWVHLLQDRVRWRSVLNLITNRRVPGEAGNVLTTYATITTSDLW